MDDMAYIETGDTSVSVEYCVGELSFWLNDLWVVPAEWGAYMPSPCCPDGPKDRRYSRTSGGSWLCTPGESGNGTIGFCDMGERSIRIGDEGSLFDTSRVLPPRTDSSSSSPSGGLRAGCWVPGKQGRIFSSSELIETEMSLLLQV